MSDDAIGITAISDLFSQCVIAVAKQVETELRRRGVTLKTADQWEQITYFQDPMTVTENVLHKVECRSKNSGDWFRVCAMANSTVKCLRIVVETATAAGNGDGDGSSSGGSNECCGWNNLRGHCGLDYLVAIFRRGLK